MLIIIERQLIVWSHNIDRGIHVEAMDVVDQAMELMRVIRFLEEKVIALVSKLLLASRTSLIKIHLVKVERQCETCESYQKSYQEEIERHEEDINGVEDNGGSSVTDTQDEVIKRPKKQTKIAGTPTGDSD